MKMAQTNVADPGDDTCVFRAYLTWRNSVSEVLSPEAGPAVGTVHRRPNDGELELVFSLTRSDGRRQRYFVAVTAAQGYDARNVQDRWALVQLGATSWDLPMSVHVPRQFHGFVTLIEVPNPPPWER